MAHAHDVALAGAAGRADVVLALTGLAAAYLRGWWRLRHRARPAAPAWASLAYLGGLLAIGIALLSPVDEVAERLLTMHMVQHALLVMVAAPLLLLANPLAAVVWALPRPARRRLGRWLARGGGLRSAWQIVTLMPVAWLVHVVTLWSWHYPAAYDLALRHDLAHDAEHLSFFLTALFFWWPVVNPAPRLHGHIPYTFRIAYLILATAQNTALAFVITMTDRVLYPSYAAVPRLWGLSALDDQALGGSLMWIVGGMMYLGAILVLVARLAGRGPLERGALGRLFGRSPA